MLKALRPHSRRTGRPNPDPVDWFGLMSFPLAVLILILVVLALTYVE